MFSVFYCQKDVKLYLFNQEQITFQVLFILGVVFFLVFNQFHVIFTFLNGFYTVDFLTSFVKIFILVFSFFCFFIGLGYLKSEKINVFEYFVLLLFVVLSLLLLVSSNDLISFYITIELQSLSLYILAAYDRDSEFAVEAGLKYFILGSLSSAFLLFGISIIYGFCGTTNFEELARLLLLFDFQNISVSYLLILGIFFIAFSFLFKITAAPFHVWAPDVYEGSLTSLTAYFSVVPKIGVLSVFFKLFFYSFFDFSLWWQNLFLICSFLSLFLGAFYAYSQIKIKRLLAYSSINNVGFILFGLLSASFLGIDSFFLYIIIYMFTLLAIFSFLLSYKIKVNRFVIISLKYISDFSNISKLNLVLGFFLFIVFFSLIGIPPLAGFWGKFFILFTLCKSFFYFLAVFAMFISVFSSFYYLRILKNIFFQRTDVLIYYFFISRVNIIFLSYFILFLILFVFYFNFSLLVLNNLSLLFSL